MDFLINEEELAALCGLPHIQQLAYLRGIRPYMDVKTGLVGIKRRISYQSLAEQLYIEPHQGIKSVTYSREQLRRALVGLERAGMIRLESEGLQLIVKCNLASRPYSVQNKADINPTDKASPSRFMQPIEIEENFNGNSQKPDIGKTAKADTPHKEDIYIYFLFEKFWTLYPEKKSRNAALTALQQLNPDAELGQTLLQALETQIAHRNLLQSHGKWIPPWKYPANWLTQRCWEDEITTDTTQETHHAKHTKNTRKQCDTDLFCPPCDTAEEEPPRTNVLPFKRCV